MRGPQDTPQTQRPPLRFPNAPCLGCGPRVQEAHPPCWGAAWPQPPTLQSPKHGLSDPGSPATLTLAVAAVGGQPVSG